MQQLIIDLLADNQIMVRSDNQPGALQSSLTGIQPITVSSLPATLQTKYKTVVGELLQRFADQQLAARQFYVTVPISADPADATLQRMACCDMPVNLAGKEVLLEVVIRHFRDGKYVPFEKPDYTRILRGIKGRKITVNGQQVDEYEHFYNLAEQMPMKSLLTAQIGHEDSVGNLNQPQNG